jgi:hypothetical protein
LQLLQLQLQLTGALGLVGVLGELLAIHDRWWLLQHPSNAPQQQQPQPQRQPRDSWGERGEGEDENTEDAEEGDRGVTGERTGKGAKGLPLLLHQLLKLTDTVLDLAYGAATTIIGRTRAADGGGGRRSSTELSISALTSAAGLAERLAGRLLTAVLRPLQHCCVAASFLIARGLIGRLVRCFHAVGNDRFARVREGVRGRSYCLCWCRALHNCPCKFPFLCSVCVRGLHHLLCP